MDVRERREDQLGHKEIQNACPAVHSAYAGSGSRKYCDYHTRRG